MDDDDELTIVVTAAAGASALERDGMLHRLEEAVAVAVSEVAVEGYVTNGSTEPDEVRLIIAAADLASPDVLSLVGDTVAELLADPDLVGWGPYSVNVTDEVDDDAVAGWDDLPEIELKTVESPLVDEFDVQVARQRLEQDAEHLRSGLNLAWLTALETGTGASASVDLDGDIEADGAEAVDEMVDDEVRPDEVLDDTDDEDDEDADGEIADEAEYAAAVLEAKYVAGAIFQSSVVVLDHLFMDLQTLSSEHQGATVADVDDAAFFVLHDLPVRYAHRYDALFVQEFIVATVDVTRRFTAGWEPLGCVAQELALRMILNGADFQLELAEVKLSDGWRSQVEDSLFEDLDHEMLFDASLDGIEDDSASLAQLRSAPLAFADWFTPFNAERHLPPYLLDEPDEPDGEVDPDPEFDPDLEPDPEAGSDPDFEPDPEAGSDPELAPDPEPRPEQ